MHVRRERTTEPASRACRGASAAGVTDHVILFGIDLVVLYSTLRMAGLTMDDWRLLPPVPMLAFLLLLKLSYFGAFTAACGQTIGKMAAHIRVVADDAPLDPARAIRRTHDVGACRCWRSAPGSFPRCSIPIVAPCTTAWRAPASWNYHPPDPLVGSSFMRRLAVFLATCGYIGYVPVAPGTFGSAAGLAVFCWSAAAGRCSSSSRPSSCCSRSASGAHRSRAPFRRRRSGAGRARRSRRHADHAGAPSGQRHGRDRRLPRVPRARRRQAVAVRRFERCPAAWA